jgi:hypothetical protein
MTRIDIKRSSKVMIWVLVRFALLGLVSAAYPDSRKGSIECHIACYVRDSTVILCCSTLTLTPLVVISHEP